jgi:hypothetical protein
VKKQNIIWVEGSLSPNDSNLKSLPEPRATQTTGTGMTVDEYEPFQG